MVNNGKMFNPKKIRTPGIREGQFLLIALSTMDHGFHSITKLGSMFDCFWRMFKALKRQIE